MEPEREADLVDRARAGSVDAFEEIVRHYQPRLTRYLRLRGLASHDADDVVQHSLLAAWQSLATYDPRWRFSTWLYTIAQRSIRKATDQRRTIDFSDDFADDNDIYAQALADNVWAVARAELPAEGFTALWLHHGEGFDGREVARIMKRSPVSVRVMLHRARKRLEKVFDAGETR